MPILNFFRKRSNHERNEILARLAASETVGKISQAVEKTSAADRAIAMKRIGLATGIANQKMLGSLLDTTLGWMRDCKLNINFKARNFFATPVVAAKYMTKIETWRPTGANVDQNPKGGARDVVEQKLFHYESGGVGKNLQGKGQAEASLRIQAFGDMESRTFQGAIRPKYCTLNVWRVADGSGALWGASFFVLKDYLKFSSTYVHSDSFDFAGKGTMWTTKPDGTPGAVAANPDNVANVVGTYSNMTRVLVGCSDSMLESLLDCTMGLTRPGLMYADIQKKYAFGPTSYIETHVHGEIHFARDIQAVKISLEEANAAPNPDEIKKNLATFAALYNVPVTYY